MASPRFPRSIQYFAGMAAMLFAAGALAQAKPGGRALFDRKQCSQCHFHEARGIALSVKVMRGTLKGDPGKTSAAISGAAAHANELKEVSPAEIRALAEWLAATTFEEQATAEAARPKPGSPEAKRLAAQKAKQEAEAKAKAAAEAKAQAKREAEAKARTAAEARIQAKKDTEARARQEAEAKALARRDADAQARAKQEKEDMAKREAEAKARKDTAALDAIRKENEERARKEAEAQATAKREADERARLEAEAKARRDVEAVAQRKRDADERAKRDAEAQAQAKEAAKAEPAESTPAGGKKKLAYRDGSDLPPCPAPTGAPPGPLDENAAKAIIERVGCPQCHAYVQKKTGPPMKKIHEKYKGDWECVVSRLTKNKTHKEEGVTDDMKGNEYKVVADYIATRAK
ncbi:MAG: hypothetical protein HZB40_10600 [Rhodocyclales bacterium]|nr:hypothetical protein [Rhodocyclales bacterium]